jgi:hypothetical protein
MSGLQAPAAAWRTLQTIATMNMMRKDQGEVNSETERN